MKYREVLILVLLLAGLVMPVPAADEFRYSYININKIGVDLINEKMYIRIDYSVDTPIKVLIYLLGNNDLKNKLTRVVNYDNATLTAVELDHAQFLVDDAVVDYGDGAMWLPEHQFNAIAPLLTVTTPQNTVKYTNAAGFPKGIGYFRVSS
ncbi:MAG: hypothetical protein LUO93_00065 [Methanomicrobiales archaeon]|nr:hypothetical protein [Methanomicrobiales archaeon]